MTTPLPDTDRAEQADWQNLLRFAMILVSMLALYAALTSLFALPTFLPRARVTIGTVTNRSAAGATLLAITGIALYALYISGFLLLWRSPPRQAMRLIWSGAILASALLIWAYPVTSTDLFDYQFRSRMAVVYGANPYLALPNQFKNDPFFRYLGWPNAPSAYGPLWEDLSWLLVWLGGSSLLRNILLYKLLAVAAHLLSGAVLCAIVRDSRWKVLGAFIWLWSPLALWEFAAVGHNDGLLVLALLLALWAVQHNRHWTAVLALTGGALLKFLPAIFLPLVVLHWMQRQPTWRRRGVVFGAALLLFFIPLALLYAPYWDLPATFAQLDLGGKLGAIWQGRVKTLRNLIVREGFLNASPLAVMSYLLREARSLAAINAILRWLSLPQATADDVRAAVSSLGSALLGIGLIWQCWHVWYRQREMQPAFFGLLLWYVLCASQWFQPWYILWPLAIFALRPNRAAFGWLTAWMMMAQASYLLQYIILPNLRLSGQSLQAQVYYLWLIYLLPLIVWLVSWRAAQRKSQRSAQSREPLATAADS
ncbi:MAG TPA: hypothetical protein VFZ66_08570 [Herpetosiphonaceae bacterium]